MSPEAWADHLAAQEITISMRFSFWGKSGWKSAASRDRALLFAKDRLLLRLSLLQSLPLPSLAAQTDQRFHLHVLTAQAMPRWALDALQEACAEVLDPSQFTIDPRRAGLAAACSREFLRARYGSARTLQVVLDDDDGLATDYLASLRQDMARLPPPESADAVRFLSQPYGYGLDVTDLEASAISLYLLRYPFINLGLALSSQADGMNLFGIAHRSTPKLYPHSKGAKRRMYVRTVHVRNDSRAAVAPGWKPVPGWRDDPEIAARFPWLLRL
jgi:hypothetical protein